MEEKKGKTLKPPQMSPYVFTLLLMGFGFWCFWDGWLTTNPDMAEHALMNQILSGILIPWAIWDYFKVKRGYKLRKNKKD